MPPFQETNAIKAIKQKRYGTDAARIDGNTGGMLISILGKSAIQMWVVPQVSDHVTHVDRLLTRAGHIASVGRYPVETVE